MHRRSLIAGITAAACLCVTLPMFCDPMLSATAHVTAHPADRPVAAIQPAGETGCGVERWSVKTGMDPDARLVDQHASTPTNIITLRALPAPAQPPLNARVKPVETTVWSLDAILLRYKQEADSDDHLVLSDTGGRTMIAEIPSPACVGPSSPFLPAMRAVRQAFTAAFHPTISFQRVNVKVHVTGVGFFDFKHGQSGVAPNAIELHPILSIRWGNAASPPPAGAGTPSPTTGTPAPATGTSTGTGGALAVRVQVSPNPTAYGTATTVQAATAPGAQCTVKVVYASGTTSTSAALRTTQTADGRGTVAWTWRFGSRVAGTGRATVTCALGGRQGTGSATITVPS